MRVVSCWVYELFILRFVGGGMVLRYDERMYLFIFIFLIYVKKLLGGGGVIN